MSWVPPRPVRRLIIDPLWLPVAAAIGVLLLVVVLVAGLLAPLTPRRRVLRAASLALVYLAMDVGLLMSCFGRWLRQPRRTRDEQAWRTQHAELLGSALSRLMDAAHTLFGFRVDLVGRQPQLDAEHPLVVLARHAGPGDSFALVHLLITGYHRNPRVVLKRALQWDPGLDVILTRLRCHFLPSASGAGEDRAAAVADLVRALGPADALLLFPEGGNWTPRRHRRSVVRLLRSGRWAQARRAKQLTHVLPPRPGGTVAALTSRSDTDVLVVAHAGLDELVNPGQMWAALPLQRRPMRVRAWPYAAAEVPRDPTAVTSWLEARWADIDQWVDTEQRHD